MNDLKIWCIHYVKLKERKVRLLNIFGDYNLKYIDFIEQYDRDKLENNELKIFNHNLPKVHCAIILSHIYAYKQIITSKYKYNLIFEDDIILDNNFNEKLEKAIFQIPEDYDMVFIGNGCNLHIPNYEIKSLKLIYKKCNEPTSWGGNGATRCVDSYLVSKKCATKLIEYIENINNGSINNAIDWLLNQIIRDLNLNIYWMEPTIVKQGSQNGLFKSSW